jgi:hypothetical protein
MFKFSGTRPSNLGVKDGKLGACPTSPNCVNSQADDLRTAAASAGPQLELSCRSQTPASPPNSGSHEPLTGRAVVSWDSPVRRP